MRVPRLASQPDRLYSEYCCAAGEFTLLRLRGNAVVTAARDVYKTARRCDISEDRPDAEPPTDEPAEDAEDAETFPASVVGDLRKESAGYRERAKGAEARADELARKLHLEPVRGTSPVGRSNRFVLRRRAPGRRRRTDGRNRRANRRQAAP